MFRFTLPISKMRQLYNSIHGGMRRLSACVGVNEIMLPKWKACVRACVCAHTRLYPPHRLSPAPPALQPALERSHLKHTSDRLETVIHRPLIGPSWHSLSPAEEKGQARGKYHQIESRRHFRIYIPLHQTYQEAAAIKSASVPTIMFPRASSKMCWDSPGGFDERTGRAEATFQVSPNGTESKPNCRKLHKRQELFSVHPFFCNHNLKKKSCWTNLTNCNAIFYQKKNTRRRRRRQ